MRVFVTGGSGFVGGHVIERLVRDGHQVAAMARSERSDAAVRGYGAEPVRADLDTVAAEHLAGCDAVIHAAAYVEDWGPKEAFYAGNVEGTRRLIDAARAAGVGRFVHVSTEAVLFDGGDLIDVDESAPMPTRHRFAYPETKAAAEALVIAADGDGLRTVVIRPRFVWGPRDTTILPVVVDAARSGQFWWIDGGRQRISTTHVSNLVEALTLALTRGEGRAWFVTDGEVRTTREVLTALTATRGVTLPDRSLPAGVARALASLIDAAWRWLPLPGRPPMTAFSIYMLAASVTIRDDAARRELGYRPVIGFDEGVAALGA